MSTEEPVFITEEEVMRVWRFSLREMFKGLFLFGAVVTWLFLVVSNTIEPYVLVFVTCLLVPGLVLSIVDMVRGSEAP